MSEKKLLKINRLPRNFHKTFMPERRYLNEMLRFAGRNESGNIQEIAEKTGIPTGSSSGKVAPTIDYCRAMGLITLKEEKSSIKKPELTVFGRIVWLEDPFMKESLTQWLAHLNLCSKTNGAEVWYQTFYEGSNRLGQSFSRDELEDWLAFSLNAQKSGLIGPMIRMYEDDASFGICRALQENSKNITRSVAPVKDSFAIGYGAWILSMMEEIAEPGVQITVTQLEEAFGWKTITGWSIIEANAVLDQIERKGILTVDRHMNPWILKAKESASTVWNEIYNDLI